MANVIRVDDATQVDSSAADQQAAGGPGAWRFLRRHYTRVLGLTGYATAVLYNGIKKTPNWNYGI